MPVRQLLASFVGFALVFTGCGEDDPASACSFPLDRGPAVDPSTTTILVANSLSEEWVAFTLIPPGLRMDTDRGLTGRAPNDIDVVGDRLYVVNSLDNDLQIIRLSTGETLRCIDLGAGANPWAFAVDPIDSNRAWITTFLSGELVEMDLSTERPLRRTVLESGAEGLVVTEDLVFVALTGFEGSEGVFGIGEVAVVDRVSMNELRRLEVPTNPQFLLEAPDGTIHVICTGNFGNADPAVSGRVARLERDGSAVRDTLILGGSPSKAAVAPDGTVFVAAFFGGLMSYDGNGFTILRDAADPIEPTAGYTDVAVVENRILAVNFELDAVVSFDATTLAPTDDALTGDGPSAILVVPETP